MSEMPLLDRSLIEELRAIPHASGNLALFLVSMYVQQFEGLWARLEVAVAEGDTDAVADGAHRLRSGSLQCGMSRAGEVLASIEYPARDGHRMPSAERLAQVQDVLRRSISAATDAAR